MSNKQQLTDKAFQIGSDCRPGVATTDNTQLPVEVVEQIKTNVALRCDRNEGKDDNSFRNGYYSGYVSGATAYATKLHQVEQATEDKIEKALHAERNSIQAKVTASETEWAKKVNELQQENEQLRQWKMEAAELLTKIHSYAHKHMEIKLGESIVDFVIARAKERDEFKSENDKLKQQATGWRPLLEEFISMHETGLLPNRFTYEKAKKFLYGE